MRNSSYMAMIAALLLVYILWLTLEAIRARRDRAKLEHVIYVNGTRGKTTVTRMIDAGLRGAGYRVLCKTTGTVPLCIHVDGSQEEIRRRAPANIREQLTWLHRAAREGAQVLVIECMALDPELQRVSARRMLGADVGVITNARLDHMDVMGQTREEILDCLMEILPRGGCAFTAERDLFPQLEQRCARLGSSLELADPAAVGKQGRLDFPENTALALSVCRAITGREDSVLLDGISRYRPDPYALCVYGAGGLRLVNALSANDGDSTGMILEAVGRNDGERLILLINNRADRPARARDMARLCGQLQPDEVWLLGGQRRALAALCRRQTPGVPVRPFAGADRLPLDEAAQAPTLLLAVGNIKDEGMRLVERAGQELRLLDGPGQ